MPVDYDSSKVKCPFYRNETRNTIKCEGVFSPTCNQNFDNAIKKKKHKCKYCDEDYSNCSHFQQVNKKYPLEKTAR